MMALNVKRGWKEWGGLSRPPIFAGGQPTPLLFATPSKRKSLPTHIPFRTIRLGLP